MRTLLTLSAMLLLGFALPAVAEGKLEILLSQNASKTESETGRLLVNLVFRNTGDRPIEFPSSYVPPEDGGKLGLNLLSVKSGNSIADYQGLHVRNISGSGSRAILGPGESLERTVDLSQSYLIAPNRSYSISVRPLLRFKDAISAEPSSVRSSDAEAKAATSNTIEVISGAVGSGAGLHRADTLDSAQHPCSQAQNDSISEAILNAGDLSLQAVKYTQSLLKYASPGYTFDQTARYTKWYGAYGDPNNFSSPNGMINGRIAWRLNVNAIRLGKIQGKLPNPPVLSTTCNCEASGAVNPATTIAWVNPSAPYQINICPNFFSLPAIGNSMASDSKAGTILHEISHFNDGYTAGTDDFGDPDQPVSEAKFMAANGRDLAADNAYNIEFYSENLEADQ